MLVRAIRGLKKWFYVACSVLLSAWNAASSEYLYFFLFFGQFFLIILANRYINFNAYIQTAIWGTPFCVSAFNGFWLIFNNLARIAAITGVTHFLSLIGKIAVIMASAGR